MNAQNDDLPDDPNAQSIVMKVEHHGSEGALGSVMLAGDSDAATWRASICRDYSEADLSSSILLASHHGSLSFFDDPADERHYYIHHVKSVSPAMTVISVGRNSHGHPDPKAMELYERYTTGSKEGNKIYRTDTNGTIKLTLKDEGGWSLAGGQ